MAPDALEQAAGHLEAGWRDAPPALLRALLVEALALRARVRRLQADLAERADRPVEWSPRHEADRPAPAGLDAAVLVLADPAR